MTQKSSALDRFPKARSAALPRLLWASNGEVGTGKTHFGLSAPGPIVVQSFDHGMEGVVESFTEHKDIRVCEYEWAPTNETFSQADAIALRDRFIEDFIFAVEHARTVLWDKETDIWSLFRYAEHGGPSANPLNYVQLNQRMRKYVNLPKSRTVNFGCIQSCKDEWRSVGATTPGGKSKGESTGGRIRAGFPELPGLVHVDLVHTREGGIFTTTVGKAHGPAAKAVCDKSFEDIDFMTLGMMLYPSTDVGDWS
jgi:hypothetical protein